MLLLAVFLFVTSAIWAGGLSKDDLRLSACTIQGSWQSYHSFLPDTTKGWLASAGVVNLKKDRETKKTFKDGLLMLISNSHVLDLRSLSQSAHDGEPEVVSYALSVTFPSQKTRPVLFFCDEATDRDLALLLVDAEGLSEGEDYVILPDGSGEKLSQGDDVVAVGSPQGYQETETFGKISAFRSQGTYNVIQTDTAINHGNSGGPLFLKIHTVRHPLDGEFVWIGVNTWILRHDDQSEDQSVGLNFAIWSKDAQPTSSKYSDWYTADKEGAAKSIRDLYHVNATAR